METRSSIWSKPPAIFRGSDLVGLGFARALGDRHLTDLPQPPGRRLALASNTGHSGVQGAPFPRCAPRLASLRDGFVTLDPSADDRCSCGRRKPSTNRRQKWKKPSATRLSSRPRVGLDHVRRVSGPDDWGSPKERTPETKHSVTVTVVHDG